jgi:hypothetical protein
LRAFGQAGRRAFRMRANCERNQPRRTGLKTSCVLCSKPCQGLSLVSLRGNFLAGANW